MTSDINLIVGQIQSEIKRIGTDPGSTLLVTGLSKEAQVTAWLLKYQPTIRRFCKLWIKSFGTDMDIEDLEQEAYITVFRAWDVFDSDRVGVLATTYFLTCVNNQFIDLYRRSRAQRRISNLYTVELPSFAYVTSHLSFDDGDADAAPVYDKAFFVEENIEAKLSDQDAVKHINAVINMLPVMLQEIVKLKAQGLTQVQIGQRLGISQASVCNKLKLAREELRALL